MVYYNVNVEDEYKDYKEIFVQIVKNIMSKGYWKVDFKYNNEKPKFTILLVNPNSKNNMCMNKGLSCYIPATKTIFVNSMRWFYGSDEFPGRISEYHTYLINHEVGHTLGLYHNNVCEVGTNKAPVMMQQTKGLKTCKLNVVPLKSEIKEIHSIYQQRHSHEQKDI